MGSWSLTDAQRKDIKPLVEEFLNRIELLEDLENFDENNDCLDLTFKGIGPYQLTELLTELEYEKSSFDTNGWQYDFWQYMVNKNKANTYRVCICGCGITFELKIKIVVD